MHATIAAASLAAALGSGLIAGSFFAFSAFVMTALARPPHGQGVAAIALLYDGAALTDHRAHGRTRARRV